MRKSIRLAALSCVLLGLGLSFASPAGAAVTGTVTPDSGLTDGQVVRVQASGLPASTVIAVIMCERGATDSTRCDANTNDPTTQSKADGTFDKTDYTVFELPGPTLQTSSIQCDATHPCDIFVGTDYNDFTAPHVQIPISFAAETTTTVEATTTTLDTTVSQMTPASLVTVVATGLGVLGLVALRMRRPREVRS